MPSTRAPNTAPTRRCWAALWLVAAVGLDAACQTPNPLYEPAAPDAGPVRAGPDGPVRAGPDGAPEGAPDAPTAPVISCPADPDLLACFRFERAVKDESSLRLTAVSSGVDYQAGLDGQALRHTPDARIQIPATTALDAPAVTLEAWIRPRTLPVGEARAAILDYQRQYSLFIYADGTVACSAGVPRLRLAGAVKAGVWTSVACTANATAMNLWVDGVKRATMPATGPAVTTTNPPGYTIGSNFITTDSPNADAFDGLIDNVRVWRRARTDREICAAALRCR